MSSFAHGTAASNSEPDYPRAWRWDADGEELDGTYVELDEGPTQFGPKGILVIDVGGELRSLWLLETALQSRLADEVARRSTRDLTAGERITIRRGDMVTSGTGRQYRGFKVRFPDRPKRSASEILGAPSTTSEETSDEPDQDADIPF